MVSYSPGLRSSDGEAHDAGSGNPVLVDDRSATAGCVLWEVDSVPVSMAARTRVLSDMARVAPVYTPPEIAAVDTALPLLLRSLSWC